ncbi:MAG TPA: bifunctional demethylmenaquinone methyltransferase/2-methoxy-6-polyprenyl-1,4-benzoquinol methylase UbiE [Coleofasciculaceae cyanobacterium]|jgi:demethylmenaquinone methyltransferase/2-methoxy-6-polyprenyl-1,4-benzoquinol methylase
MTERALSTVLPDPARMETEKATQVRQMFDRIAGTYDTLNNCISLGFHKQWKRLACGKLNLPPGGKVLDVCTGTGDLVGYLQPLVGPHGQIEGLDFSGNMLTIARQRFQGQPNVNFTQGDALALPYPDKTFDGAIISFGLRNVTDTPQALAEMYRVIKPGGWMVNLDTCPTPAIPGMNFYFSRIMPLIGGTLAKDQQAYQYLSESTRHFLTPAQLKTAFESAGCVNVSSQTLMLGSVSLQTGRKAP